jgi:hypothetical protein
VGKCDGPWNWGTGNWSGNWGPWWGWGRRGRRYRGYYGRRRWFGLRRAKRCGWGGAWPPGNYGGWGNYGNGYANDNVYGYDDCRY